MGARDHGEQNEGRGGPALFASCLPIGRLFAVVGRAADAAAQLLELHPAAGAVERDRRILHRRRVIAGCAVAARERILALRADQHRKRLLRHRPLLFCSPLNVRECREENDQAARRLRGPSP